MTTKTNPNRSSAAQFFMDEDESGMNEDYAGGARNNVNSSAIAPGGGGGAITRAPAISYYGSNQRSSTSTTSSTPRLPSTPTTGGLSSAGGRVGISSSLRGSNHHNHDQHLDDDEEKIPELLMKAAVTSNDDVKLENLQRVKDIIVIKQPALLDNFLDEILNFQLDANPIVRRFILDFILHACEADPEIIPKILDNMVIMLGDAKVSVQKKAIQVSAGLYKQTLMWLCKSKSVSEEMESTWNSMNELKKSIIKQIDSDNDAIRTHTVKFIETVILLQTPSEDDGVKRPNEFCLDQVPITVKVARPRKLEEDARNLFEELLKFHGSRHATSVNLMTVMGSIVIIAKLRPSFMARVVTAMEKLNAILPPTLERSQVTSVRKYMKAQLITLLRHPKGPDYYDNITTLLTDLGATFHELSKAISNWDSIRSEKRKRHRAAAQKDEAIQRKRARREPEVTIPLEEDSEEDEPDENEKITSDTRKEEEVVSHLDEMEKLVFEKLLQTDAVADLVVASMEQLPDTMPAHFMASFTPIAIAGTESQVRHVSRLLATQITAHQLGPSAALQIGSSTKTDYELDMDELMATEAPIPTLVSAPLVESNLPPSKGLNKLLMSAGIPVGKKKGIKTAKLSEITKPFNKDDRQSQIFNAIKRILKSKKQLSPAKCELVSSIVTNSGLTLRYYVMQYINEDIKNRLDLGLIWIFGEYSLRQGYMSKALPIMDDSATERYEWTFYNLMKSILDTALDAEKAGLAWRLYMEPPVIPDGGLDLLKKLCSEQFHCEKGMQLLTELAMKRPKKLHYLSAMLEFCSHANEEIRTNGVKNVLKLYTLGECVIPIEDKAVHTYLSSLRHPNPPEILFTEDLGRPEVVPEWSEELVKSCLHLYMQLLTVKNELIHNLANVYVETTADIKRTILRVVEPPVRKMGMNSPALLKLLDTFPKGSETLITRIIHILTDKALPSAELVTRVRNLYSKRVSDVRFLIPVLNGLSKAEILSALPKLIKLNPNVVKEVFNRLLGIHSDAETQHDSPITPIELMVALHNIDSTKCDVKTVIKATSLCFNESEVYTAEVLASVINQLLEQSPFPILLMRTIIQAIALHSKLTGFVMNILGRMVGKQIWTQPKVWEGFVKCCQRTIPKSIPILLTLPLPQLNQALIEVPELREPIYNHLMSFSQQQRGSMNPALLDVVFGNYKPEVVVKQEYYVDYRHDGVKEEPRSPSGDELSIVIKNESTEVGQSD